MTSPAVWRTAAKLLAPVLAATLGAPSAGQAMHAPTPSAGQAMHGPAQLNETRIAAARFGNDAAWYRDRIPFFDSSDPAINAVYYYRWSIVRAHQRDLGAQGFVTTEFLDEGHWNAGVVLSGAE